MKYAVYVVLMEDTNSNFERLSDIYPEQYDIVDRELSRENAEDLYQAVKDVAYGPVYSPRLTK